MFLKVQMSRLIFGFHDCLILLSFLTINLIFCVTHQLCAIFLLPFSTIKLLIVHHINYKDIISSLVLGYDCFKIISHVSCFEPFYMILIGTFLTLIIVYSTTSYVLDQFQDAGYGMQYRTNETVFYQCCFTFNYLQGNNTCTGIKVYFYTKSFQLVFKLLELCLQLFFFRF